MFCQLEEHTWRGQQRFSVIAVVTLFKSLQELLSELALVEMWVAFAQAVGKKLVREIR
jgi:hypothetical protein